jgi:hypothetical protein
MFFGAGCTIIVGFIMKEHRAGRQIPIVSVTGAHSGVGKTSLCALLLRLLPGFGAIKFTKTELYTSVIDDPEQIMEGQKDTAVMYAAGAESVVWVRSRSEDLKSALNIAFLKLAGVKGIIVEGNSPSMLLSPELVIFVLGQDCKIKDTALPVMDRADIVIFNAVADAILPAHILPRNIPLLTIDLRHESGEIDKLMVFIKKYISRA